MISYELAKKLKDAGFHQDDRHWYWVTFTYPYTLWCINALEAKKLEKEYECMFACPTLSELIEACGDGIYSLRRTYEKDKWVAHGYDIPNREITEIQYQALGQKGFVGLTPEEAVANLWLALNEKK